MTFAYNDCLNDGEFFACCEAHTVEEYIRAVISAYDDAERGNLSMLPVTKRLFFRGHGDFSWDLLPSAFRTDEKGCYSNCERSTVLDYKQYSLPNDCYDDCETMLCNMQHYGIPTRLLDWTVDPLMALCFATEERDSFGAKIDKPGCVWIMDPWSWNRNIDCEHAARGHDANVLARSLLAYGWKAHEISGYLKQKGMSGTPDLELPYCEVGMFTNQRKIAQNGCFMIWGVSKNDLRTLSMFRALALLIIIPRSDKEKIRRCLNLLDINEFSVYPDGKGFSTVVKEYGSIFSVCSRKRDIGMRKELL